MAASRSCIKEKHNPKQVLFCPKKYPSCVQWFALCNRRSQGSGDMIQNKGFVVVYVLGGPGSGKGTQCSKIAERFGFTHLSVGELLEAEVKRGSETGKMTQEYKKEGKLVPSEIVVKLLKEAMQRSGNHKFLIDGFPRNEEHRVTAEKMLKIQPTFVLVFDCCEEELIRRILNRNQGRVDDNIETIQKRLKVYREATLPVIDYYTRNGKARKINAERPAEEVFKSVEAVFSELGPSNHWVTTSNLRKT